MSAKITTGDIDRFFRRIYDFELPFTDNSGLLIGDAERPIKSVFFCLDADCGAVLQAVRAGAGLIVSHHPVIFDPLLSVETESSVYRAIKADLSVISVHLPVDYAVGGANLQLADILGLPAPSPWLKKNNNGREYCEGYFSLLDAPAAPAALARRVSERLGVRAAFCAGRPIRSAAVCGGSGGFLTGQLIREGLDCLITGEVRHEHYILAKNAGVSLISAGHFATEIHIPGLLSEAVKKEFPSLEVITASETSPIEF